MMTATAVSKMAGSVVRWSGLVTLAAACSPGVTTPPPGEEDTNGFDLACSIPSTSIFSGATRDGIPALTNPNIAKAGDEFLVTDDDRVLGVVVNGEARAYPFFIMWWHEVVNDTLGGEPILVSYCPLTGSGIAFDPRVDGGDPRNFGVSGLIYENNLIMFDRETESLWNQMLLGSQCGPSRGAQLERLPIVETTWRQWKALHPNTTILTFETGYPDRAYGVYPYDDYAVEDNFFLTFPSSSFNRRRPPKELVIGVAEGADAVTIPFGALAERGNVVALNEALGETPFVVAYVESDSTAIAYDRRVNGQALTFAVADPLVPTFQDAETGSVWNLRGEAVEGSLAGERLEPLAGAYVAFWFAWSVYYPNLRLVE